LLEAVTTLANHADQLATSEAERQRIRDTLVRVEELTDDLIVELEPRVIDVQNLITAYEQPRS